MNDRTKSMLIGLVAGALLGALFGSMLAEEDAPGRAPGTTGLAALKAGDYFKIGISLLTLARELGAMTRKA